MIARERNILRNKYKCHNKYKLDVDPQRDDDASPMSTYGCMSNSISNFYEKKYQIVWFPCCSTREDLSIDVSITNVGLILTKLG